MLQLSILFKLTSFATLLVEIRHPTDYRVLFLFHTFFLPNKIKFIAFFMILEQQLIYCPAKAFFWVSVRTF